MVFDKTRHWARYLPAKKNRASWCWRLPGDCCSTCSRLSRTWDPCIPHFSSSQSRGWHQRVKEQQSHLSKCSADKYLCYLPVKFDEKVWLLLTPAKLKLRTSMRKSQQFQMSQSNENLTHSSEAMLQWSQCETCSQQILTNWTGKRKCAFGKPSSFDKPQNVQRIYHWQFSTCRLWELLCQIPSATPAGTADGCPAVLQSTKCFCISWNRPLAPIFPQKLG